MSNATEAMSAPSNPPGSTIAVGTARRASWRRWAPAAVLFMVVSAAATLVLGGWLHPLTIEQIVDVRDHFQDLITANRGLAVLIYTIVYAVIVALSVPSAGLLTLAGGLFFGWFIGGAAAVVAATIGASLLFQVTRVAAGDRPLERLGPRLTPILKRLETGFQRDALNYMLFLRLVPAFPFCVVNVAPALLGVPFPTFLIGTAVGILPATFAISSLGAGLDGIVATAKADQTACLAAHAATQCHLSIGVGSIVTPQLELTVIALSLLALVPVAVKHWKQHHAH